MYLAVIVMLFVLNPMFLLDSLQEKVSDVFRPSIQKPNSLEDSVELSQSEIMFSYPFMTRCGDFQHAANPNVQELERCGCLVRIIDCIVFLNP